jgi:hypothetical protein
MQIPHIRIVRDDIVTVTDAFILTFFVNESHESLVNRVEQVLGLYVGFVGLSSIPFRIDEEGEIEDVDASEIAGLQAAIFHGDPERDTSVIRLVGAVDDQTGYGFTYIGDQLPDPRYPALRNLISMWLSTDFCLEVGWETIYRFSCDVAILLPYSYGYGSPCLAYGDSIRDAIGIANRHEGLDIALGYACRVDINDKALGAYWLSFFGESLWQSLGGEQELYGKLTDPITIRELPGNSIVIRLGPEPLAGDKNRQIDLPLHRQLAKIIERRLHVPQNVYFPDENGLSDIRAMTAWHRRFLGPG